MTRLGQRRSHRAYMSDYEAAQRLRLIDLGAREVAIAAVEWLASDGDDDKLAALEAKVNAWRELVRDA